MTTDFYVKNSTQNQEGTPQMDPQAFCQGLTTHDCELRNNNLYMYKYTDTLFISRPPGIYSIQAIDHAECRQDLNKIVIILNIHCHLAFN
jgi:hypothetical protein